MQAVDYLAYAVRLAIVAGLVCVQAYLLTTYGVEPGVTKTLMWQTALQALAVAIAPPPLRVVVGLIAGWASVVLGLVLMFFWVTVVVPMAVLIGWVLHGDPQGVAWLLGLTAYLALPAGVACLGYILDDAEVP